MCSTEDEGSRLNCTISHSLASNLMGTALRTQSLVYIFLSFALKDRLRQTFRRYRKIANSDY
jgi:hypothetical protein